MLAEGSRFGAYVIGPCVGHGGSTRIYRAEHEVLRREVALKVLTPDLEPDAEDHSRFLREARIAASIKHPNVVNVFDVGVEGAIPYLVMELLVGQDLETRLSTRGPLDDDTLIDLIIPVVAGLVAVHAAGVVHRDLKPGNIFLATGANDEIEPKLLDFGISQSAGVAQMRLTSTDGLSMGTPLYMSPEALLGNEMTPASDQYSLGVVLYECTTGVKPFLADTMLETARRVTAGQFVPISEQPICPSPGLQAIIERAMRLHPSERFPDMRALGQELLQLAGQRTRIAWGLSFDNVAAIVPAQHGLAHAHDLEEAVIPLVRARVLRRSAPVWPWVVGSVAFAAAAAILVARHQHVPIAVAASRVSRALERHRLVAPEDSSSAPPPASTVERVAETPAAAAPARAARPVESDRSARRDPNENLHERPEVGNGPRAASAMGELEAGSIQAQGHFPPPRTPEIGAPTAALPEIPDWITKSSPATPIRSLWPAATPNGIGGSDPPTPPSGSTSFQVGTNEAPIFD